MNEIFGKGLPIAIIDHDDQIHYIILKFCALPYQGISSIPRLFKEIQLINRIHNNGCL